MVNKKLIVFFTAILVVSMACSLSGEEQTSAITVAISAPTEGQTFTVGQEVYVVASVIAENGVEKAYLSVNGQIIATEEPGVLPQAHVTNFLWVPVAEGNVKLSVVGTDGEGQSSEPVSVNVVIGPAPTGGDQPGDEPAGDEEPAEPPATDTPEPPAPTDTPEPPADTAEPSTDTPEPPTPTFTYTPHPPTPTLTPTPTIGIIITLNPGIIVILPQVETVWDQVSVPANSIANATVECPAESTVVGGGFATNTNVYVYTHNKQGNGWQAYGSNFNASNKLLNVYAVCLKFVAGASVQQVYDQVNAPANGIGHAVATCPAGTTVVGGGYASKGDGTLRVYTATKKDNGYQVYAKNHKGSQQLLNAYAICLSSDRTTHSELVWENVDVPSSSTKGTQTTCPSGMYATGGGFAGSDGLEIYNNKPKDWNIWEGYGYNTKGSSTGMNVYAICLAFDS